MADTKHPTRTDEARDQEWKEPNELEVPEAVLESLKATGCEPRWIRVSLGGKEDSNNIMTKLREGYTFVKWEDVEEIWSDAPSMTGKHGNLITVGDLALAKLPISISESRKRAMAKKTRDLTEAIDRNLFENSPRNLNQLMPVQNNSRSQVFRGRQVQVDK
jgi:hypothetical protein